MTSVSNGGTTTLGLYDTQSQLEKKADITYVDNKVDPLVGGHKGFATLAQAQAAQSGLAANTVVEVLSDTTEANNGYYLWNGITLTKTTFIPLTQANNYTDIKVATAKAEAISTASSDATNKSNTARTEAIATAATLSSLGEWLTEDGKTTLSTLNISNTADANKLKVIRTIEKIALLNASLSDKFYVQSVLRNQGTNGSRIHVQRKSQLGTNNRVASLIIADSVTTVGIQEYTVEGTDGIKLKILVNWDNFETNTSALNVNLPINNLKFLKELQNESQLSSVPTQIATAKTEAMSAAATDATSKASSAETNAKNYTDQFFNQFLINQGDKWES